MIINCVCVQTTPEEQLPYSTARCIVVMVVAAVNCICVQTLPTVSFFTHYSMSRCIVVMVVTVSVCRHSLRSASLHKLQYRQHGVLLSWLLLNCICVQTPPTVSFLTWYTTARRMDRVMPLLPSLPNSSVSPVFIKRLVSDN